MSLQGGHKARRQRSGWARPLSAEVGHKWGLGNVYPTPWEAGERWIDYRLTLTLYFLTGLIRSTLLLYFRMLKGQC